MALGERGKPMRDMIDDAGARRVPHHRHRHEARADRRVRRDGLHHRQVRPRPRSPAGAADRALLRHRARCSCCVVLGADRALAGFSILSFIAYISEELLIVLGTTSSESALPQLMEKLQRLGCSKPVVGLVVPTGYSFNLDGTNIYMTLATLFLAQATDTPLTLAQQLDHPGRGDADLQGRERRDRRGLHHAGRDARRGLRRSRSPAGVCSRHRPLHERVRALTNMIGNGVATVVVSRWEGELDHEHDARQSQQDHRSIGCRDTAITTDWMPQ